MTPRPCLLPTFVTLVAITGASRAVHAQGSLRVPDYATFTTRLVMNLQTPFATETPWSAVVTADAGVPSEKVMDRGVPSQSKLCFVDTAKRANGCTTFADLFHSKLSYQELSDFAVTCLSGNPERSGLVMRATADYPTGQLSETAIWVYDRAQDSFVLAATFQAGEARIFGCGPRRSLVSRELDGHVVISEWVSLPGETRFGSDHKRKISVYGLVTVKGRATYRLLFAYTTLKKYSPEDTNTIGEETHNIRARLTALNAAQ